MRVVHPLASICVIAAVGLLAGPAIANAGEAGVSGSFAAPNPCALLSSTEVFATSGVAVKEGAILFRNGATASCRFTGSGGGRVAVFLRRLDGGEWAAEQVERMRRGVSLGSYRETRGVGERAFLLDMKAAGAVLCVFQGPYYLQIAVLGGGPQRAAVLEELAVAALRRLAGPKGSMLID